MTPARRSDSKLPYRRQKSDLEVSRHGSRNVEVSLFQQDYMPLPPLPNRPESVKLWEQHMEVSGSSSVEKLCRKLGFNKVKKVTRQEF